MPAPLRAGMFHRSAPVGRHRTGKYNTQNGRNSILGIFNRPVQGTSTLRINGAWRQTNNSNSG